MPSSKIANLDAIEILDSRGFPTVLVTVTTEEGVKGQAMVPSGASTGELEALELRDGDKKRYKGKGVKKVLEHVKEPLAKLLKGEDIFKQKEIDFKMCEKDGSENKSRFGANAILGVSLAVAQTASQTLRVPLYEYLGGLFAFSLPCPMLNVLNGGAHADNGLEFQEFMIRPHGAPSFSEALRWGSEVYHTLKELLKERKQTIAVGDEGGFAPRLSSNEAALDLLVEAIQKAGYRPGTDISLALDCAASQFFDAKAHNYSGKTREQQVESLISLCRRYPIDSIEDGMAENDWEGWKLLQSKLGNQIQIVGDDLFVTNTKLLERGIQEKAANSILIKVNQIGTLSETLDCISHARKHGFTTILSHRSGETEDTFIADLAVAVGAGQIKTGAPCRGERTAKYNRLLYIESELGCQAFYTDSNPYKKQ